MPRAKSTTTLPKDFKVERFSTDKLLLDDSNPRLAVFGDGKPNDDLAIFLWKHYAVEEVALSIAHNGFFAYEPLFVEPSKSKPGHRVVVEGNRRLAAVMLLRDEDLRRRAGATSLPDLSAAALADLRELPVVTCNRDAIWEYLGFRHINGPKPWGSESKAQYVAHVHNSLRIPLDQIASTIGDTNRTVKRLYRAHMILEQAESIGVFQREDRVQNHFSFSHLLTGLGYEALQRFLGIEGDDSDSPSPVPGDKQRELEDVLTWMYGSRSKRKPALIRSQNPDLRHLIDVIGTKGGVSALRSGAALEIARDVARGDQAVLEEAMHTAKRGLSAALGAVVTGFDGDQSLRDQAVAIKSMALELVAAMERSRGKRKSVR